MNSIQIFPKPYLMKNKIQHYAWGTKGREAFIPRLLNNQVEPDKSYAELWLGTHVNAPSEIKIDQNFVSLYEITKEYPAEIMGKDLHGKYGTSFPFLLKILSAGEALSIQAHPNKEQAETLHTYDPEHYPDDNHKPEIAIALDHLTALVGFKDVSGIMEMLEKYPEIKTFTGDDAANQLKTLKNGTKIEEQAIIQKFIQHILTKSTTDKDLLMRMNNRLKERLISSNSPKSEAEELYLELEKKYTGNDIGLLFIFLLRIVHLKEGDGIFLKPGIPHAYIKGNIIECMANSDNVVRIGLTPKFKDTETLIQIMDYDTNKIPIIKGNPGQDEIHYEIPSDEFKISRLKLEAGRIKKIKTHNKPVIILNIHGDVIIDWLKAGSKEQLIIHQGESVFMPAFLSECNIHSETTAIVFKVNAT